MRVLYLTDNPTLGGTIRILQGWLPLAAREGIEPFVVTPPRSDFLEWLSAQGVAHTSSPMPWPSRSWPFPSLWHAWRLARWARKRRIELIHVNEHNIYPFCVVLKKLLRLPVVCHVRYQMNRGFTTWAFGGSRRPDALLWTSRQQKHDCAAAIAGVVPEEKQHLVYLGLDLNAFGNRRDAREPLRQQWGVAPGQIVVGQVCALRARKRIEEFIDLVATLAREDERVVGVLAGDAMPGDEPYKETVLRRIAESGLGPRFRWLGNVDDVEPVYQAMDVFVSTSEYETFGNSVCEAMACGRPVAAYQGGSVEEVVGDAGRVAANADIAALNAAVREMVRDAGLREALGRHARARVEEHFNPAATLHKLAGLYQQLLGREPAAKAPRAGLPAAAPCESNR
jgi:glycosyltransferase involved in cell wall biosynthesis